MKINKCKSSLISFSKDKSMGAILFIIGCIQGFLGGRFWGTGLIVTYAIFIFLTCVNTYADYASIQHGLVQNTIPSISEKKVILTIMIYIVSLGFYSVGYGIFYGLFGRKKKK